MPLDVSYGELIVIDGIDVSENIVQAGQHAIAYATTPGAPGGAALTGISAETFYFSENVDVSKNVGLRGNLDVSGTAYIHNVLDVSKNALFRSNVGIGTENPNNKLEVVGDICCTTLKFDSSANQTNIITYNRNPLSSRPLNDDNNFTGERFTLRTERSGSFMKFYSDTLSSSTSNNDSSIRFDGALGNAHFKGKVAIGMGETAPGQHLQIDADEQSAGLLISDITNKNDNVSLIFSSGKTGGGGVGSTGQIGGMCLNYHCKLGPGPTSANAGPKGGLRFQRCDEYTGGNRTDLMVITASGELGIGTLYPTTPLEIITTEATNSGGLLINNTSSGTNEHAKLTLKVASSSGLVANPYISFQTGAGTSGAWSCGIDNSDIQKFKISQSGNELHTNTKLTITTDGNVGIGTTSPFSPLSITAAATSLAPSTWQSLNTRGFHLGFQSTTTTTNPNYPVLTLVSANEAWGGIYFKNNTNTSSTSIRGRILYYSDDNTPSNEWLRFYAGSELRMTVKGSTGNVGIGTSAPEAKLHIQGSAAAETYFIGGGAAGGSPSTFRNLKISSSEASWGTPNGKHEFLVDSAYGEFEFKNTSSTLMYLQYDGNVGIGTSAPSKKLEVVGDISCSSLTGTLSTAAQTNITSLGTLSSLNVNGNVGIGTTNPSSKLSIVGSSGSSNGGISIGTPENGEIKIIPTNLGNNQPSIYFQHSTTSYNPIMQLNSWYEQNKVFINYASTNPTAETGYLLHVNGGIFAEDNVTGQNVIVNTGNISQNINQGIFWDTNNDYGIYRETGTWNNIDLPRGMMDWYHGWDMRSGYSPCLRIKRRYANGNNYSQHTTIDYNYINTEKVEAEGEIRAGDANGGHAPIYAGGWSTPVNAGSIVFRTTNYNTAKNRSNTFSIQSPTGTSGAYTEFEVVGDGLQIVSPNTWNYGCFRPRPTSIPSNNDSANFADVINVEQTNTGIRFSGGSVDGIIKTLSTTYYTHNAFLINFTLESCTAWGSNTSISDDRIKYNEKDISNALITVNKLKPKFYIKESSLSDLCFNRFDASFNFTENDLSNGLPFNTIYESGYIAQDISNDIPELKHIVTDPNDPNDISQNNPLLSVDYTGIQPYLTKAIQELHQIVQTQETTISSLQTLISTLQTQNTALEARIAALEG